MTDKEYLEKEQSILDKCKKELFALAQKYFEERGNVHETGTTLKLKDGSLIVEHARFKYEKGKIPSIIYTGQNLTTEGKVSKRQPTREILETEIVRVIRTRKSKDE